MASDSNRVAFDVDDETKRRINLMREKYQLVVPRLGDDLYSKSDIARHALGLGLDAMAAEVLEAEQRQTAEGQR
jgi:hypothetical protein